PVPNPAYPRPETLHQTTTQPGPAGILPRPRNRRAQIRLRYPDLAHEQSQRARPQTHQNPTENFRPTHQRRRHPRPPRHPQLPRHRPQTRPQRPERPPRRPHRQPLVPTHPHTNLTHSTPPNTAVQHQHGGNSARPTTRHVNVYAGIIDLVRQLTQCEVADIDQYTIMPRCVLTHMRSLVRPGLNLTSCGAVL